MKNAWIIFSLFLVIAVSFTGCKKIDIEEPDVNTLDKLVVTDSFDWKTSKAVTLNVTGYASNLMKVVSPEGSVYHTVFLNQSEKTAVKITVPSYETTVHLLFMGQNIEIPLSSSTIDYIFN